MVDGNLAPHDCCTALNTCYGIRQYQAIVLLVDAMAEGSLSPNSSICYFKSCSFRKQCHSTAVLALHALLAPSTAPTHLIRPYIQMLALRPPFDRWSHSSHFLRTLGPALQSCAQSSFCDNYTHMGRRSQVAWCKGTTIYASWEYPTPS